MTKEDIRRIVEEDGHSVYGLRMDYTDYQVGDTIANSHQWYQDPQSDDDTFESDNYNGFLGCWDYGELDGTCAIAVTQDTIEEALESVEHYEGDHLYLIGGDYAECGNDCGEVIIEDARVLAKD